MRKTLIILTLSFTLLIGISVNSAYALYGHNEQLGTSKDVRSAITGDVYHVQLTADVLHYYSTTKKTWRFKVKNMWFRTYNKTRPSARVFFRAQGKVNKKDYRWQKSWTLWSGSWVSDSMTRNDFNSRWTLLGSNINRYFDQNDYKYIWAKFKILDTGSHWMSSSISKYKQKEYPTH